MTDPSKERIAAALALAEAVDAYDTKATEETAKAHQATLAAYRATAPKPLRTRAEVDAEIGEWVRAAYDAGNIAWLGERLTGLCREPLAPDPTSEPNPYGPSSDDSADSPPSSVPAAGEPEACGCEESDALKAELAVLRAKISDCANHAQAGIGQGKYPSCMGETSCRWIYQRLTQP